MHVATTGFSDTTLHCKRYVPPFHLETCSTGELPEDLHAAKNTKPKRFVMLLKIANLHVLRFSYLPTTACHQSLKNKNSSTVQAVSEQDLFLHMDPTAASHKDETASGTEVIRLIFDDVSRSCQFASTCERRNLFLIKASCRISCSVPDLVRLITNL